MPLPPPTHIPQHPNTPDDCTFCGIACSFPPTPAAPTDPSKAHIVVSTPGVIAFLDIYPLARCHILVCPRRHAEKLHDMTSAESSVVGAWLPLLARAATNVSGYTDFNVVQNNGVHAAQVVPHVHYHIIPRPDERQREALAKERTEQERRWWRSPFGGGWRYELEDEEGTRLAEALRAEVERLLKEGDPAMREGLVEGKVLASL